MTMTTKTDVLVIGGGAAGIRAAIEARKNGCKVTILSYSKAGRANNTAISFGGFAAAFGDDDPQAHFDDTMKGGHGLNQPALVRLLVERVPAEVKNLETMGVQFQKRADGTYIQVARGGHTVARRLTTENNSGVVLIDPLVKYLKKIKVNILEGLRAVRLLIKDGTIQGVLAIDRQGQWSTVLARSVVLAVGGGGALYPATTNVPSAYGEGYALAFEAGLCLRDMEFVQFVAVPRLESGVLPRGLPPLEVLLLNGAILKDANGEDLFELSGTSTFTRDIITRIVEREIQKNRPEKGYVQLDLSRVSADGMGGISDLADLDIQVQTASHFFMGGIEVNPDLTTAIPGFFAAGEVMGGVHGANRLGGNALAETFVFGAYAGDLSARFATENQDAPAFEPGMIDQVIEEVNQSLGQGSGEEARLPELEKELKSIMEDCVSPVRNLSTMKSGIDRIQGLRDAFQDMSPASSSELWSRISLKHQIIVADMILCSALKREESRGAHFREDFPQPDDDNWLTNILLKQDKTEGCKFFLKPVTRK